MRKIIILSFLFLFGIELFSQTYPKDYFRSPLDINLYLSGTFAELRSNHFHSGIDIKTQGVIGKNVYSIADGYVSRIKVSPWGYGKAIYIQHPNGYTSVYGHLNKYSNRIDEYVKAEQYKRESFSLDYFPEKGSIKVKKGEIIGLSGNSGSSGGPHLHFEIRNSRQQPINPFYFGIEVEDNIRPTIRKLFVYYLDDDKKVAQRKYITLTKSGKYYVPKYHDTLAVSKEFYLGVLSYDKLNGAPNQNGIYSMQLFVDSNKIYDFTADKFSFKYSRYLNSLIDYDYYKTHRSKIHKAYSSPNSILEVCDYVEKKGIIEMGEESKIVEINVLDFAGNTSTIKLFVKLDNDIATDNKKEGILFKWNENNEYKLSDCEFFIPNSALYEDIYFSMKKIDKRNDAYSSVFQIHNDRTPLHKYSTVKIKPDSTLTDDLKSKAFIASISSRGTKYYEGGDWDSDFLVTKTRSFGKYYISVDTIAPKLRSINVYNGKNVKAMSDFKFKITDDFSGIKVIRATLNDNWILMDYDPKRNLIVYEFDEKLKSGTNYLKVTITDNCNNSVSKEYKVYN